MQTKMVVAGGVIDEGLTRFLAHQGGVADTLEQMNQGREFTAKMIADSG